MKVLLLLVLVIMMMWSSEASGRSYTLTVPQFYTVFSGDLELNYSIPGNVALPNGFIRLEFWSKSAREDMIITTMGLRLGYNAGTLRVSCGVIEFAGNYTLRMYTRVNGEILTETSLDVIWPEVSLSLPDNHEAQTSTVELRIHSRANCSTRLQRYFLQLKLLFYRTEEQVKTLSLTQSDIVYTANFTSISVPYTPIPLLCNLFDLDGLYQAVLLSSSQDTPLVASSNIMSVVWSSGDHLRLTVESAFPCYGSITLIYTLPACSGLDKFRLYSFTPTSQGSPASPLQTNYMTEVVANPNKTKMSFECKLFNQSASGFCFVYVTITRGGVVSERAKTCIPAQANSVFPIDGVWSKWTSWTSCSVTCGSGRKSRFRMCNAPAPKHGGRFCVGNPVEWTPCELHCPESIPRTPLHSPDVDPNCSCGCSLTEDRGKIIATGRCHGLSTWIIKATEGHVVALRFDYFSLNYTRQWVKVRDGSTANDVLLFSSSTINYPMETVTSGSAMRVELMTSYVTPPPVAIFPKNATLPIHAHGFIASYDVRATLMSSTAPVLFQYTEETVMGSTITIVGIVICAVVIIIAVVFVIVQRTFFRRRVKYVMTSSGDSPAHQSQTAGSSNEHRVSSAQSSSPSSPGNTINVDMDVPLTGKTQRKNNNDKPSRASSTSSINSQKKKHPKAKGEPASTANCSPKTAAKDYAAVTSPYGIEIVDTDEKGSTENSSNAGFKTPRTPKVQSVNFKHSPITPISPVTKLDMLNRKRQEKKGKGVTADVERDITGSSGSRSPSTTKAEVNWPQSSFVKATLNEVSRSLTDKHKRSVQRPPSEEIPLLDSMTSSQESPSHFNNMVKSESTDSATTSFVRPVPNKARRPTSLTESYSNESIEKSTPKTHSSKSGTTVTDTKPKPSSQGPAILHVQSVQFPSSVIPTSFVNIKQQPALSSFSSFKSKRPIKQPSFQASINNEKSVLKSVRSAFEERLTILPKPDGQSPKLQRRESATLGASDKDLTSPGKTSKASSRSSKNNVSSPARSIATPSEAEGLELEYDDFVEDDPLSYFDYEETQKLAFRGVEKIGKSPVEEEDEDEDQV